MEAIKQQGDVVKVYELNERDFNLVMIGVVIKAYPDQRYYIRSLYDSVPRRIKAGWGRYGVSKDEGLYIDNGNRNHKYFLTSYDRCSITHQTYKIQTNEVLIDNNGKTYPKWMDCPIKTINFYQGVVDIPTGESGRYWSNEVDSLNFNAEYKNPIKFTFSTLTVNNDEIGNFILGDNKKRSRSRAYSTLMSQYYERRIY